MDKDATIKELLDRVAFLEAELITTKEHLKKYTAPASRKEYYEKNKEAIKERINNYKQTYNPTPEQKKKWARTAYLNSKNKQKQEMENTNSENI